MIASYVFLFHFFFLFGPALTGRGAVLLADGWIWCDILVIYGWIVHQVAPLVAGLAVAAAAYAGRYSIQAWQTFKARPRMRKFYEGGFQPKMTRREAALILGVRCVQLFYLSKNNSISILENLTPHLGFM